MSADTPVIPTPTHIPWYQSQMLKTLAASFLAQVIAFAVSKGWITAGSIDATTAVGYVFGLGGIGAVIWAVLVRIFKPMPVIVASKAAAIAKSTAPLNPPPPASILKLHWAAFLLAMLIVPLMLIVGCTSQLGVVAGQTPEQKAAGLLGDFTVYQGASLKIGTDETVPQAVRQKVLQTAIDAKPLADSLDATLRLYRGMEAQLAAGATTQDKVDIAALDLASWVTKLEPLVTSLRSQVEAITL